MGLGTVFNDRVHYFHGKRRISAGREGKTEIFPRTTTCGHCERGSDIEEKKVFSFLKARKRRKGDVAS